MPREWIPLSFAALLLALPAAAAGPSPDEALLEASRKHQALAEYEEAARGFAAFARQNPKHAAAPRALADAVALRLAMGQPDVASLDAELFVKTYGAAQPAGTVTLVLAVAENLVQRKDWAAARRQLDRWLPTVDDKGELVERILAHAWHARSLIQSSNAAADLKKAEADYAVVRELSKDARTLTLATSGDGDQRRLGRALIAEGEALYFFAEQKRREVDRIRMPSYRGNGQREDVLRFIQTKVVDWIKRKRPGIEAVEKEYRKVVEIQPAPPPEWVVASAARVGQMWGRFVAEFRATPIPREWKGHGLVPGTTDLTYDEIRALYYTALDEAAEPQRQVAKGAFKTCLDYSAKFQFKSEFSSKCEAWLSRNYQLEFHRLDELLPAPTMIGAPQLPPAPLPDPRQ